MNLPIKIPLALIASLLLAVLAQTAPVTPKSNASDSTSKSVRTCETSGSLNDRTCPICFERADEQSKFETPCAHNFHKRCLMKWANRRKNHRSSAELSCPLCRGKINGQGFENLCLICEQPLEKGLVFITSCKHRFHINCILVCSESDKSQHTLDEPNLTCPECVRKISYLTPYNPFYDSTAP